MSNQSDHNLSHYQPIILISPNFEPDLILQVVSSSTGVAHEHAVFELIQNDKSDSLSVDQVRGVAEEINKKDLMGKLRVYSFPFFHSIGHVGQNAILKILEEPPQNVLFILHTNIPAQLLPTIFSRCRVVKISAQHNESPLSQEEDLLNLLAKDSEGKLMYQNDILDSSILDLQTFSNKIIKNIDQTKLAKLWLFAKWSDKT